jgi:hypothetical protein
LGQVYDQNISEESTCSSAKNEKIPWLFADVRDKSTSRMSTKKTLGRGVWRKENGNHGQTMLHLGQSKFRLDVQITDTLHSFSTENPFLTSLKSSTFLAKASSRGGVKPNYPETTMQPAAPKVHFSPYHKNKGTKQCSRNSQRLPNVFFAIYFQAQSQAFNERP